ncbi:cytochrome c oxidase subunit 6b-1 [Senna tora]|uniref:Cytochrome c oxidase subunit 6b-1 n=1 Tax=Senna tora TaxID=362788 RepID=A0A834TGH4_9FABA|nr:cytochrome c oxidase subunit 6b-1 [Senna tora]
MAEATSNKSSSLAEQYFVEEIKSAESSEGTPVAEESTEPNSADSEESDDVTTEENSGNAEEENSDDQEPEETPEIKLETAPADFRFPTTNQTRHCFTRYVEFHRCVAAKGDDAPECDRFAKYYRSLCPGEWWRLENIYVRTDKTLGSSTECWHMTLDSSC